MALKWKGRVRETTTTTGTGALALGGAVTSYGTFASLMSAGDTCYGTVAHRTTTEWEDCLFTMESNGTLTRTTVIDGSSGAGVAVSLSAGTKDVFLGLPPAIVETLLGASLVTLGTASYVTSERVATAGTGITLTDGGAGSTLTFSVDTSAVDHGGLGGLTDDDHTRYVFTAPTTDARNVIQPTAATVKALVLKGAASQSDNLLEVQNSSGTVLTTINSTGAVLVTPATMAGSLTSVAFKIAPQDTSDYFSFTNATGSAGRYLPTFIGETNTANDTALYFVGRFPSGADASTTSSAIIFDGRTTTGALSNRPIAEFRNFALLRWRISPAGVVSQYIEDAVTALVTDCLFIGHNTSGTAAAGFGAGLVFRLETSTTADTNAGRINCRWGVATHASREGIVAIIATDYGGDRTGLEVTGNGSATEIGFFGVTPTVRPSAYTQTYATADKTHADFTSSDLTDNTTGTANTTLQALTDPADTPASADALRDDLVANLIPELRNNYADLADQHNKLRADLADLKQLVNSLLDDLQTLGLLQ